MSKDATEYEAKVLNIDEKLIKNKLDAIGATKLNEFTYRRYVFDTIPKTEKRWVRLRTDGEHSTLTVKEILSHEIDGTLEWEVTVSDIDDTLIILDKIGIKPRGYQENTRILYTYHDTEIAIDKWPKLETYIEIEAKNKANVIMVAKKLGYDEKDLTSVNTEDLYSAIGIDLKKTEVLRF